jgi:hypothetical protein
VSATTAMCARCASDDADALRWRARMDAFVDRVKWTTPPKCQGQIVTRSYGATMDYAWERTVDASDGSLSLRRAEWTPSMDAWWERGAQNSGPPDSAEWEEVDEDDAIEVEVSA